MPQMFRAYSLAEIATPNGAAKKQLVFLNAVGRGPDVYNVTVKVADDLVTFRVIGIWRRPRNRTVYGEGGSFRVDCINVLDGKMPEALGKYHLSQLRDVICRGLESQVAPAEVIPFGIDRMDVGRA